MTQDEADFIRLEPGIDRHGNQPGLEQPQIDLRQRDGIQPAHRDPDPETTLVPLAMDPEMFPLVPLRPLRMVQTSIFTPVLTPESRLIAEFKACLREEARLIEKRVASLLGNSRAAARRQGQPAKPAR